jgi:hypothetical protein
MLLQVAFDGAEHFRIVVHGQDDGLLHPKSTSLSLGNEWAGELRQLNVQSEGFQARVRTVLRALTAAARQCLTAEPRLEVQVLP